jgi:hypothetical protein
MQKPTYDDAALMLKFVHWVATSGIDEAINRLWSDDFIDGYSKFVEKYPPGTKEYGYVTKVCGWYETIGTLYKNELFNERLLFDWLAVGFRWKRLENFVLGFREKMDEQNMYENFEAMAKVQIS